MSSVLSSSDIATASDSVSSAPITPTQRVRWTREPLLHFILIGAVLFGVDALIAGRADDPHLIEVTAEQNAEMKQAFMTSRQHEPNAEELNAVRQAWLDNEVLYREGLSLGLDKGDPAIRDRVIFKALSMVDANTKTPPYDDKVLKAWFEKNRVRYDIPKRFNFQEAVLSGDTSERAVRVFVSALNSGTAPDAEAGLRVFTERPHNNIVQSYGADFAATLEASPPGEWRALQDKKGWRAMRLESTVAGQLADFDQLRGIALQDWTDEVMAEQRTSAVRALAKKYTIKIDGETK